MDRVLLNQATSVDEQPVSGIILRDVAKATLHDAVASELTCDYLVKKLSKDNPVVVQKALRCVRACCEHGRPEFKRDVQRSAAEIKACLQFKGINDPLRGDALNKAVRTEAEMCLRAMFSNEALVWSFHSLSRYSSGSTRTNLHID